MAGKPWTEEQRAQRAKNRLVKTKVEPKFETSNAQSVTHNGVTTKFYVNSQVNEAPAVAKYTTVGELVKGMEGKASADEIAAAVEQFMAQGVETPTLRDIHNTTHTRFVQNPPVEQPKFDITTNTPVPEGTFHVLNSLEHEPGKVQSLEEAGKGKICLLFPCFSDTNAATTWALTMTAKRYHNELRMDMESGDSMIVNSRNQLAGRFLDTGCEWSIWLDSDMIPPVGRPDWFRNITMCDIWADFTGNRRIPEESLAVHFIDRLMSHQKSIVGAMYTGRQVTGRPMFHEGVNNIEANRVSRQYPNELRATEWVATGCLLVHRQVYIDMRNNYPELAPTEEVPRFDYFRLIPGKGEDASFCSRAKKLGHQPYVDLGLHCGHVGKCAYGAWNTTNKQLGV